jgi:hypothetical protein
MKLAHPVKSDEANRVFNGLGAEGYGYYWKTLEMIAIAGGFLEYSILPADQVSVCEHLIKMKVLKLNSGILSSPAIDRQIKSSEKRSKSYSDNAKKRWMKQLPNIDINLDQEPEKPKRNVRNYGVDYVKDDVLWQETRLWVLAYKGVKEKGLTLEDIDLARPRALANWDKRGRVWKNYRAAMADWMLSDLTQPKNKNEQQGTILRIRS